MTSVRTSAARGAIKVPYKVRYTPKAQQDMDGVWSDVLEVSKETDVANQYVDEFADKIAEKKVFPNSGIPLHYRGLITGFYSVNFKAYKAFYRVMEDYIEVLRIIPAKRDYMKVLFGELEQD